MDVFIKSTPCPKCLGEESVSITANRTWSNGSQTSHHSPARLKLNSSVQVNTMSFKMVRLAKQIKGLSRSEKLVLVTLADYYNEGEGCAWPSHETMAQDLHYERTTVIRACKGLLKKGLISWYKEMGPSGHFSSNRYKLHLVEFCHTAKSQDTGLQDSTLPCGKVQQKPVIELLVEVVLKKQM